MTYFDLTIILRQTINLLTFSTMMRELIFDFELLHRSKLCLLRILQELSLYDKHFAIIVKTRRENHLQTTSDLLTLSTMMCRT